MEEIILGAKKNEKTRTINDSENKYLLQEEEWVVLGIFLRLPLRFILRNAAVVCHLWNRVAKEPLVRIVDIVVVVCYVVVRCVAVL